MKTQLDRLLDSIHPDRTTVAISRSINEALNRFRSRNVAITDWEAYRRHLVDFHQHVEQHILGLRQPHSGGFEFDWGRCMQVLRGIYGPSGFKAAFEIARTGNEGGLNGVLRKIAEAMAEGYAHNGIAGRVHTFWNGLSASEKIAAGQEYLAKFGHLLPSELAEGGGARILADLPKVLQEHPRIIERLSRVGRRH